MACSFALLFVVIPMLRQIFVRCKIEACVADRPGGGKHAEG
jgi:hypothetical protein